MLVSIKTGKVLASIMTSKQDLARCLSVSKTLNGSARGIIETKRTARMMKKLMTGTKHFARKPDTYHPSKHLTEFGFMQKSKGVSGHRPVSGRLMRRVEMLNNLFIEQITSLLATGEVSPEFLGLGVQISKVKVSSDFSVVNVYWFATGTEKDETIDRLLTNCAGHLRHELTQLRVIGMVPPIKFHRDRTYSKLQEVELLLNKFDLGTEETKCMDDNTSNVAEENATERTTKFSEELDHSNDSKMKDLDFEDSMSHDILGVNHDRIMNEIKKSLQKQSDKKRAQEQERSVRISSITLENSEIDTTDASDASNPGLFQQEIANHQKRQKEFLKYLKKQQVEKAKKLRLLSTEAKDQEFYTSMKEERRTSQLFNRLNEIDDLENDEDDDKYGLEEETYYENLRENFK